MPDSERVSDKATTLGLTTLFETQDATGLRATYFGTTAAPTSEPFVVLLPSVDGGLKANSSDGSDFRVIERGICYKVTWTCGTALNEWGY